MSENNWNPPSLEAEIAFSCGTITEANAVVDAVSPDNERTPEGLVVKTMQLGRKVMTNIVCRVGLLTFIATIDDLLEAASIAEKSVSVMKENADNS